MTHTFDHIDPIPEFQGKVSFMSSPEPLSDERLAEIEARHKTATQSHRCQFWQVCFDLCGGVSHMTTREHIEPSVTFHAPDYVPERELEQVSQDDYGYYVPDKRYGPPDYLINRGWFIAHSPADTGDLLAEVKRLRDVVDQALTAGHCHPSQGSDRGQCLIDHVALGYRERVEMCAEVKRLRHALLEIYKRTSNRDARAALDGKPV